MQNDLKRHLNLSDVHSTGPKPSIDRSCSTTHIYVAWRWQQRC